MQETELQIRPSLSAEQQVAHNALVDFARGKDPNHDMMLLKGYAGTGKTFTIGRVIHELRNPQGDLFDDSIINRGLRIAVSAPTHKAVRVLRKFSDFNSEVQFATIHSLLGLREDHDERTGKIKFVQSKDPDQIRIEGFDVIIIDEVSMLNDELFMLLLTYTKPGWNKKFIFLGDPVQIPPVSHPDCIPFKEDMQVKYKIGVIELSTIRRQAMDNPILIYATRIRKAYKTASSFEVETHKVLSNGIIRINTGDEPAIKEVLKEYFCTEEFKADADYMKVIAWRNTIVDGFNAEIRKLIYNRKDLPFLMEGEKLIVDKPVLLSSGRILLTTNEELTVINYEIKYAKCEYTTAVKRDGSWRLEHEEKEFKCYNTIVEYYDHENKVRSANIRILHEDESRRFWQIIEDIKQAAQAIAFGNPLRNKLWVHYFKAQKLFAQVKYNYAITGHKSQGSTYANCMVVDWDIEINRNIEERNRIRYVAATRARSLLFIVK